METSVSSQTESARSHTPPSAPARSTAAQTLSARMDSADPGLVSVIRSVRLLADLRVMSSIFALTSEGLGCDHTFCLWVRTRMEKLTLLCFLCFSESR